MKWLLIIIPMLMMTSLVLAAEDNEPNIFESIKNFFQTLLGLPENPIGYETTNGFLHTWNQNHLGESESNIWQNISADYMQFFNGANLSDAMDKSKWLKHEFSIRKGDGTFLIKDYLKNPIMDIESDEETYWLQNIYNCTSFGNRILCGGFERGQLTNDTYMDNNLWFNYSGNVQQLGELDYAWKLKEIDIENDGDADRVRYCSLVNINNESYPIYDNICSYFDLDNLNTFEISNLTYFKVQDKQTYQGHFINWNQTPTTLRYEGDGNITLLSPILNPSDDKIEYEWIDAEGVPCTSGSNGTNRNLICTDDSYNITGYIRTGSDTNYSNTEPRTGGISGITSVRYKGFFAFNVSESGIPKNAVNVSIFMENSMSKTQPSNSLPTDWVTNVSACSGNFDDCVLDNAGLEVSDWDDGTDLTTPTFYIDWSEYCAGNEPCNCEVEIGNWDIGTAPPIETLEIFNETLQNDSRDWFFVIYEDNSDYPSFPGSADFYRNWQIMPEEDHPYMETHLVITYDLVPEAAYCHNNYSGIGDWYISNDVFCDFEEIPLDGNIYINNSANFYINNSNLTCSISDCYLVLTDNADVIIMGGSNI